MHLPWFSSDVSDIDVLFDDGECIWGNMDWCCSEFSVESIFELFKSLLSIYCSSVFGLGCFVLIVLFSLDLDPYLILMVNYDRMLRLLLISLYLFYIIALDYVKRNITMSVHLMVYLWQKQMHIIILDAMCSFFLSLVVC